MNKDMLLGEALSLLKVYGDGVTSYSMNEAARTLVKKIEENYSEKANTVRPTTDGYLSASSIIPPWQNNG